MMRALSAAAAAAVAVAAGAAPLQPNFMFIMSDDLGYGELSIMPGRTNTNISTPNIDQLFRDGAMFTEAYAGEAVCAPSRAAFMTGLHTGHGYIRGNAGTNGHDLPMPANETTFLQILQGNGYHVACVGKWGLGWYNTSGAPHLKGCDTYYGVLDQNYAHNMYPTDGEYTLRYPAANGSLVYEPIPFPENANATREYCMSPNNDCVWTHSLWTQAALAVIRSQGERERTLGAAAKPLFLYLAYTDPHAGGWLGTAEMGNPVPSDGRFSNYSNSWPAPEMDHASVIENYQDVDVGIIRSELQAQGLTQRTAVLYASDNGASNEGEHDYMFFGSSGPLRGFKRCLTEGGIRSPLAITWPGTIPAGSVFSNFTAAFWDLGPTILDMAGLWPSGSKRLQALQGEEGGEAAGVVAAGALQPLTIGQVAGYLPSPVPADSALAVEMLQASPYPYPIDGTSVWDVVRGAAPPDSPHQPLYWEFCTWAKPPNVTRGGAGWAHAVRMGRWKAVSFFVDQPFFLYDLWSDIGETTDLAAANPDIIAQAEAFAKAAHVDNPIFPVTNCRAS